MGESIVTMVRRGGREYPTLNIDGRLHIPTDQGCELAHYHPAFSRCSSCPLPRCLLDYPPAQRRAVRRLLRGLDGAARPPRRRRPAP